jgi:DNA-binding transcriptional MocR family regulator
MRYTADQLARMLVESGARSGPLHSQLSQGLRELIELGELPVGATLPAERALAGALSVSRTTVVTAYQSLQQEGRLERRQGSGTRVRSTAERAERETVSSHLLAGDHAAAQFLNGPLATIDFATAALPCLPVVADTAAAMDREEYLELGQQHHGYHPRGLPALRERLARWYTEEGLPTTAEQILVTSGAQQAVELVTQGCLQAGDSVVVEEPTYRGALEAFALAGCRVRSVPSDERGMDVAALVKLSAPRLVYAQSTLQNPSGAVLAPDRARRLVKLAEEQHVVVVDDTALAGTAFEDSRPLASYGDSERILTIGSMSKLFWGGLRLGWIRGASRTISRLAQMKGITDLGTSLVSQQIGLHLLSQVGPARAVRREELAAGLADLTGLLTEHLPSWTWVAPRGGASLWVRLPGADTTQFAQVALRFGVALLPGAVFSASGGLTEHTRLPYAVPPAVLRAGVHRLARAWSAYLGDARTSVPVVSLTT